MKANTWIVIANASRAFFYTLNSDALDDGLIKLKLIHSYEHLESRKKDMELVTDRRGLFKYSDMGGYGDFVGRTDPKEHEADVFAKELTDHLESGRTSHQYTVLILITPSHFLGLMKKHIDKHVFNLVKSTIEKDYTQIPIRRLTRYLKEHLLNGKAA